MKSFLFVTLMLLGINVPANARIEVDAVEKSPIILFWLDFHISDDNDDEVTPYSFVCNVTGKLYTNGQMELTFDNNEVVTVDINLNNSEVSSVEFVPTEDDKSLTFDLDDFGKGAYEVNVTMPDGSVQTATFEY